MSVTHHIAIDLGAESGRVMLGSVDPGGGSIELQELHRFPSHRTRVLGSERWDVLGIYNEILIGLTKAGQTGLDVRSISVDSWGVDYVLLKNGHPHLAPPFMYRDPRTDEVAGRLQADREKSRLIFEETGIQFLPFNTLYQLLTDHALPGGRALHDLADGMLLIGDYFNYLLCGVARAERSLASTAQLYNPVAHGWSDRLIGAFGLHRELLPELVDAGAALGPLTNDVAEQTGLKNVQVIATCSHDTGAAVAATPLEEGSAYLSSGTWSLLGVERAEPVITDTCRQLNFTNEVGFGHTIRLLKNISGLFIVQECRKDFLAEAGGDEGLDYATLANLAREAEPLRSLIRPELPQFAKVGDMTQKIADFCRQTNQPVPTTPGQFVRCIYDSLGLLYGETLGQIEQLTGSRPTRLNIVGGGSRAETLNQIAADACGISVDAGPTEATALGNIGIQAISAGTLSGLDDLRALVRRSFPLKTYTPQDTRYPAAADRFAVLR